MTSREAAHDHIQSRLRLPAYYGRNLDALWDLLSTWSEPLRIRLVHEPAARNGLGAYARPLMQVLSDAARENPHLVFVVDQRTPRLVGRLPEL